MEFIQIAYCCITPFLLIVAYLHYNEKIKQLGANLLATANVLLPFYSVFIFRQMLGLYHLAKQAADLFQTTQPTAPEGLQWFLARQVAVILLPLLFLWKKLQASIILTVILLLLLFWDHPVTIWNTYDLGFKIASYFFLFCSGYALLWLLNLLPYQSSPE